VVPLARHVLSHLDPRIHCVGSNYIWMLEINRVMREMIGAGRRIVAERLAPLARRSSAFSSTRSSRSGPAPVLNTLVGVSAYSFYRAGTRPSRRAVIASRSELSLSLCEAELRLIGADTAIGHLVSSVYFQSIDRAQNRDFLARYRDESRPLWLPLRSTRGAFLCAMLLPRGGRAGSGRGPGRARGGDPRQLPGAARGGRVDADNNHCYLTPRLAAPSRAPPRHHLGGAGAGEARPLPRLEDFSSLTRLRRARPAGTLRVVE